MRETQVTENDAHAITAALTAPEVEDSLTSDAKCLKQDSDDSIRSSKTRRQRRAEKERKKMQKKRKRQF